MYRLSMSLLGINAIAFVAAVIIGVALDRKHPISICSNYNPAVGNATF
jgi:hypothetical protein